jgi:hypothetical protein
MTTASAGASPFRQFRLRFFCRIGQNPQKTLTYYSLAQPIELPIEESEQGKHKFCIIKHFCEKI